jgi:hypothetical protein
VFTQANQLLISGLYRVPTLIPVQFTLAGASSPSVFGGHVESVTRLVTGAPAPFFRVRFPSPVPNLAGGQAVILPGYEAPEGTDATVVVSRTGYTANPADALEVGRELDVQCLESGTAVDTAGRIVFLWILVDAGATS